MPNVVTPFHRRNKAKPKATTNPRHRREGWFDDKDQWHDSEKHTEPAAQG